MKLINLLIDADDYQSKKAESKPTEIPNGEINITAYYQLILLAHHDNDRQTQLKPQRYEYNPNPTNPTHNSNNNNTTIITPL
jgi:hypothetical protein